MVPLDGNADILRRFTLRDASKSTQVVKMLCPFARTQNFPPVILCLMLPKTASLSYHIHLTLLPLSQNPGLSTSKVDMLTIMEPPPRLINLNIKNINFLHSRTIRRKSHNKLRKISVTLNKANFPKIVPTN